MKKDWKNMSDKELDEFFRQKVEEPDIPFVPGDWDKMKQKLQSPTPGPNGVPWYKNNLFRSLTAIILLGSAWLAWTYRDGGSENENPKVQEDQMAKSELIISEGGQAIGKDNYVNEIDPNKQKQFAQENTERSLNGKNEEGGTVGQSGPSPNSTQTGIYERKTGFQVSNKGESKIGNQQMGEPFQGNQMGMVNRVKRDGEDIFPSPNKIKINGIRPVGQKEPIGKSNTVPDKKKADYWQDSRWSVAALLSPDVSALKINDLHGLGTSAGLHVEYFLLPQWSITLGGLYSFKTYQGDEGYQSGYSPSPSGVKGDCWVLDVPLNIRFYAINNELDRWYISSGFSSYFMLRERYELEYSSGYYQNSNEVDVRNSNQHFMGIVNFSLGYERILSPKLSLQVEPYFKLPVTGIGEGEVDLKSAGAFIGLKYRW